MSALTVRLAARACTEVACDDPVAASGAAAVALVDHPVGASGRVARICASAAPELARRLFDLGFVPGAPVTVLRRAPLGGPLVIAVADYQIALRAREATCIRVWGTQA